ncbi:MAG: LuxR C-terminal-related transcriptional regulator [Candidatus Promineifilaceae bacterium]
MNDRESQDQPLAKSLTPREQDVLDCIGRDMTNRQIAEELTFAMTTVKWYVRQVYNKLGVNNRQEAITQARHLSLLPTASRGGAVRHNLRAASTPFVGRERELKALSRLLADPQNQIITILGPGGIGKTRLALEAAGLALAAAEKGTAGQGESSLFSDGIYFISLAPVETVKGIITTLAATLEFYFHGTSQNSRTETQQILDYLKNKQMLLVMDNFEQILDGSKLLTEIGERAAGIKVLVTSRERLQLRGAQLFPLQGLEIPEVGEPSEASLAGNAAVQLFLNISKRMEPDFNLHLEDANQLVRICRLVEGMPLGLELAASWVSVLPLANIAEEIEQSFHLLAADRYDLPERHRSMQAALDASWKRLNPAQKIAFQGLTVFRGGFTRLAALEAADVTLPLLVTLTNKSWLSYDRTADRYNIHELLRQFGANKLGQVTEKEQAVRDRHSAFFCGYLKQRERDWFGARQKKAMAEVQAEIENIQSAWYQAANQGDVTLLSQGLDSLCRFYFWKGRVTDGQYACHSAGAGLSKWQSEHLVEDSESLTLLSRTLAWETEFTDEVTQKEALLSQSQQFLDRAAASGWDVRYEQAFTYLKKARAVEFMNIEASIRFASLALKLYREVGDIWSEAKVLQLLGRQSVFQGAYDRGNNLLRDSLEIRRRLVDKRGIAETTIYMGVVARHQGHFEEAENLQRQALVLTQESGNQFHESECLGVLSVTLTAAGDFIAAREAATLAIKIEEEHGLKPSPFNLIVLSRATIHLDRDPEAMAMATKGLESARERGTIMHIGFALMVLGRIALVEGELSMAKGYLLKSANTLAEQKHVYQALPRAVLSYVSRALGEDQAARDYLLMTLRSGIEYRSIMPLMICLPLAALITADEGRPERAVELYSLAQQFRHITNSCWYDVVAGRELTAVLAALPADAVLAATSKGRELDIWETAEQLLLDLASD